MRLQCESVAALDMPTGHVASLWLPIPLGALLAMDKFIEKAYGEGATVREHPKGWLMVEVPTKAKGGV